MPAWTRDIGDRQLVSTVETIAVRGDRLALHRWQLNVDDGALSWDVLRVTHWNDRDLVAPLGHIVDALARLDEMVAERGEVLVNRGWTCWGTGLALLRAGRPDLIVDPLGDDAEFIDEHGNVVDSVVVDNRRLPRFAANCSRWSRSMVGERTANRPIRSPSTRSTSTVDCDR